MLETYSNGSATPQADPGVLAWDSVSLDWPVEVVITEAEVAASREPRLLEWVSVRILQEFPDDPPTLGEAAQELGIQDPVFLVETLKDLDSSDIVEKRDPAGGLDFANCRLTEAGRAFLDQGRLSGLPERHGLRLHLDLITGEHIRKPPRNVQQEPKNPLIASDALPTRRTTVGLDRARELARDQDELFLVAGSKITNVTVQCDEGVVIWRPYDATIGIDGAGVIHCRLVGGTDNQQQWLDQLDLRHEIFERFFMSSVSRPHAHFLGPTKPHANWRQTIDGLVSPAQVVQRARDLVRSARQEVFAHLYWLTLPDVRHEMVLAEERGIRHIAFGRQSQAKEVAADVPGTTEILQDPASGICGQPALLVDGSQGLSVDQVELTSPGKRKLDVIVASSLTPSQARQWRQELLAMAGRL